VPDVAAGKTELDDAGRRSLQAAFDEFQTAAEQTIDAVRVWNQAVAPDCDLEKAGRGPVGVTQQTVAEMAKALAPLGIKARTQ